MSIYEKLLAIQGGVDKFVKDGKNTSDKYDYVSSDQVLAVVRPLLVEQKLLLIPSIVNHNLLVGETKSGTTRYMTELDILMTWVDCESGEKLETPYYAQGVDLAGEKGVGKALTYAEKYFFMKLFHVPTGKDDPDSDGKTKSGEKPQRGTQAAKETAEAQRAAVGQMVAWFVSTGNSNEETIVRYYTKNDAKGYAGVASVADISTAALPVVYSKMATEYKRRKGPDFADSAE